MAKNEASKSAVLHRHLNEDFPSLKKGKGNYLYLDNGHTIFDASGGAAVACIGHGNSRVVKAAAKQMKNVAYCSTIFYTSSVCEQLCRILVDSTDGVMERAYVVSSGLCNMLSSAPASLSLTQL